VLVVSEESQLLWKRRRDALEIGDNAWIMSRPFRGRADWLQWSLFADALAAMVREMSLDLIIIDTIGSVWPVEVENDASPVVEALSQLEAITAAGAALLCTHHLRKSGGTEGMAARGSGAILGVPDVLMELRRYQPGSRSDRRRVLTRYSRLDETDEDNELVLELGDNGYTCCGSRTDVRMDDRVGRIMDILAGSDDGMTIVAIQEAWGGDDETEPVSKRTIQAAMNNLITDDRVERTGVRGSKKNPYRYSKKEEGAAQRSAAGTFL
jgi:hypothetical protein